MKKFKLSILISFLFLVSTSLFGDIVYIEPYTINASKGDIILTGSPSGFIGATLTAGFGGYWSHSGMMIDNGYHIRHNTLDSGELSLNTNWLGIPTSIDPNDLEHGKPGLITQKTQWVRSTDVVLKPLDADEENYRPFLEEIADTMASIDSYYRIHSYINSSKEYWLSQFSTNRENNKGTHCSGQLWYVNYLNGKEMNYFHGTTDMVDAGALALYQGLYEMILEEVESKGGFWGNAFDFLGFIDYEEIAGKLANQVVNAFGLNVYNDTGSTWRGHLGKTETYAVAPDHFIMTSMSNPTGNNTGIQTSESSYYGKIESTVKGGGYYLDTETGLPAEKIVTIYKDANFSGSSKDYYETTNLSSLPWNDAVSSIKVKAGYKVTLYEHGNYGGHSWSYYCDNGLVPWNDSASSMKIEKHAAPVACIFKDSGYKEIPVCYFGEVSDSQLSDDIGNDRVSSVRIFDPDYRVVLYQHTNFGGTAMVYSSDTSSLGSFNDEASSVKVIKSTDGMTVSLKSAHSKYMVAESGGGNSVNANRSAIGSWERFTLEAPGSAVMDGGKINIRTVNNYYLSAQSNGNLDGNRSVAYSWETFTLINHSNPGGGLRNNDIISLKSVHNKYVVAESNGKANANRSAIGSWERFTVIIH
ncbi:MAG: hypothetical protein GY754_32925 [bacterium]|nr:hypothetical protein [bacterium]